MINVYRNEISQDSVSDFILDRSITGHGRASYMLYICTVSLLIAMRWAEDQSFDVCGTSSSRIDFGVGGCDDLLMGRHATLGK